MTNKKIAIIDYGLGNLYSISKAFGRFSKNIFITDEAEELLSSDAAILPGVGAFGEGMEGLKARGLVSVIKRFASSGKPLLGICLGAQMMMRMGREFGNFEGLDLIKGESVRFPELKAKIPHIGWNKIYSNSSDWIGTVLDSMPQGANMYFVHSFILRPDKTENILALSEYGGHQFCSAIKKDNIFGTQFHPEKSGEEGLKIIKNFIELA